MSYQTLEALKERKIDSWLKKRIITQKQYIDIINLFLKRGFWEAIGYATRLKYRQNPSLKKKYEYKWIDFPKKECLLKKYVTTGFFSNNKRKRYRIWRNTYFFPDGKNRVNFYREKYPDWEVFFVKHGVYRIGLRRVVSDKLPVAVRLVKPL